MKFLKNENTGKTDASQRIMISSSSRLTMVTSTINLIFSRVEALTNSPSNRLPISSIWRSSGRASQAG